MTPHSVLFFCQNLHPSSEQSGSNSISFGAARSSSAHVICMSAVFGQQCCVRLHGPKSLTDFKLYATSANIVMVPCTRTQHVWPNNVAPVLLCLFAWTFRKLDVCVRDGGAVAWWFPLHKGRGTKRMFLKNFETCSSVKCTVSSL